MRIKNNQRGFTLIELLIVIGILATLAAVAIPTYARFFGQGEEEANLTELSNIQAAMDANDYQQLDKSEPSLAIFNSHHRSL